MRNFLLCIIAMTAVALPTFAQEDPNADNAEGTMYIIPVNSDGSLPALVDGQYQGQVPMIEYEGSQGVSAKNVRIDYGFVFEGVSSSDEKRTFYKLSSGTLNMDGENTLSIAPDASEYISVEPGTYDITLLQPAPGRRIFTITRSKIISGTDNIETTVSVTVTYYDCNGHILNGTPTSPGVYIVSTGSTASKILIR